MENGSGNSSHEGLYPTVLDRVIRRYEIGKIPGDLLEVGVFVGSGTRVFAEFARGEGRRKTVWVVDTFESSTATTPDLRGAHVSDTYQTGVSEGKTQLETFLKNLEDFSNLRLFAGDSRAITLPSERLCFAFIDCGHSEECVSHELREAWKRIVSGGAIAMRGYHGDHPEVFKAVNRFLDEHGMGIEETGECQYHRLLWIVKSGKIRPKIRWSEVPRVAIASYGENLEWTRGLGYPVTIYDASGRSSFPGVIPVENRAREAGQYLHHIVSHYPDFYLWEVFLQGNPFDHLRSSVSRLLENSHQWRGVHPVGGVVLFNPTWCVHDEWASGLACDLFGAVPERMEWVVGAQFAVHRNRLLSRPLSYWKDLHAKVLAEEETSPWAMERLWLELFNQILKIKVYSTITPEDESFCQEWPVSSMETIDPEIDLTVQMFDGLPGNSNFQSPAFDARNTPRLRQIAIWIRKNMGDVIFVTDPHIVYVRPFARKMLEELGDSDIALAMAVPSGGYNVGQMAIHCNEATASFFEKVEKEAGAEGWHQDAFNQLLAKSGMRFKSLSRNFANSEIWEDLEAEERKKLISFNATATFPSEGASGMRMRQKHMESVVREWREYRGMATAQDFDPPGKNNASDEFAD